MLLLIKQVPWIWVKNIQKSILPLFPVNAALPSVPPNNHTDYKVESDSDVLAAMNLRQKKCFYCGNKYHPRYKCPAKGVECLKCSKEGHFAKVCKSTNLQSSATYSTNSANYDLSSHFSYIKQS